VLLLEEPTAPDRLVALIQAEMGERLLACEGSRDYGSLSVVRALCAEARILRRVPPVAFWPAPRVSSVLVELRRRPDRPDARSLRALHTFLGLAFHARRKTLANSVSQASGVPVAEVCRRLALPEKTEKRRAESFPPVQLLASALSWASNAAGERNSP